jgi:hypothetical protein
VLVGEDAEALGRACRGLSGRGGPPGAGRHRLMGVLVGDPASPAVAAAAAEMASELWQWARPGNVARPLGPDG